MHIVWSMEDRLVGLNKMREMVSKCYKVMFRFELNFMRQNTYAYVVESMFDLMSCHRHLDKALQLPSRHL